MKSGLWVVIVVVTGMVGFLVGYSVSSHTGTRRIGEVQASEHAKPSGQAAAPASGYGAGPQQPAAAGGYGAPEKPAAKPSPVKPAAAGY